MSIKPAKSGLLIAACTLKASVLAGGENAWEAVEVSLQGRLGSISDGIFDNVDEKPVRRAINLA